MSRLLLSIILCLGIATPAWASSYRDSTTANGTGTAITATVPAGTVSGDVVLVFLQLNSGTATCADDNGGTPFTEDVSEARPASPSMTVCFYSRRITTGEPSPYAFTASASTDWRTTAVAISNPHGSVIYDAGPTSNCGVGTTMTATGLTTSSNNALLGVFFGVDAASTTFTNKPSGYTERENSEASDRPQWLGTYNKATAGVESDQTLTEATAAQYCAVLAAIEEPVATNRPIMPIFLSWLQDHFDILLTLFQPLEAYAY